MSLDYNYRTRSDADEMRFKKGKALGNFDCDRFSLPPVVSVATRDFTIIKRPEIPELLDSLLERYL